MAGRTEGEEPVRESEAVEHGPDKLTRVEFNSLASKLNKLQVYENDTARTERLLIIQRYESLMLRTELEEDVANLRSKYELTDDDIINPNTGEITRVGRHASEEEGKQ